MRMIAMAMTPVAGEWGCPVAEMRIFVLVAVAPFEMYVVVASFCDLHVYAPSLSDRRHCRCTASGRGPKRIFDPTPSYPC